MASRGCPGGPVSRPARRAGRVGSQSQGRCGPRNAPFRSAGAKNLDSVRDVDTSTGQVAPTPHTLQPMRVLHVGSGFRPLRVGGLVAYIEELMDEQVRRGDEVSYFFAGRYFPFLYRPRLK